MSTKRILVRYHLFRLWLIAATSFDDEVWTSYRRLKAAYEKWARRCCA